MTSNTKLLYSLPATIILVLFLIPTLYAQQRKEFHQWAETPPMGWNSWDCFGPTVTEDEVKENADYMAAHLKKAGWEYIVVDIRWYVSNDKAHGYNEKDPQFNIDKWGRLTPAVNRFPSAANGNGFKPLANYIHQKGLKFGIHIMRGVPVIAVKQKLPVKGTSRTAADIYSPEHQSMWLHDMYTIKPGVPGAQEYYNSILDLYASWGVDFIKVDDLTSPIYFDQEVEMIRKAIDHTGRRIILSTSPGETPIAHASHVQQNANMWRTVGDFWDSWDQLKEHFDVFERWNKWRISGAWPDGDMLPLGKIGIRAERGDPRYTSFSKDEQRTLMALWCMFRSPLMFGGNLPDNQPFTDSLLTNPSLVNILQHSSNNHLVEKDSDHVIWSADGPNGEQYIAFFNTADQVFAEEERAIFKTSLDRKHTSTLIDVELKETGKIYLAVSNHGDNIDWDHVDWISPKVYNNDDTLLLTKWNTATTGWGSIQTNKSISGNPMSVNKKTFGTGVGVHANSILEFDIPTGYTRFKVLVALDDAAVNQNTGATVDCLIFSTDPRGPVPPPKLEIPLNQKLIKTRDNKTVTDLWTGKVIGKTNDNITIVIPRHGCGLYGIK